MADAHSDARFEKDQPIPEHSAESLVGGMLRQWKPGVPRRTLFFAAAGMWAFAGGMLLWRGDNFVQGSGFIIPLASVVAGVLFFRFLFHTISGKHIARIRTIAHARPCFFSFLNWRGYAMMAGMITMGIALRSSGVVPPMDLGVVYLAMGTPLLLSSIRFFHAGITHKEEAVTDRTFPTGI